MTPKHTLTRRLAISCLIAGLLGPGRTGLADDTDLFTANVPPNVLLLVDNSGSMAHVVWHEAYDPTATPSCNFYDNNATYYVKDSYGNPSSNGDTTFKANNYTRCGQTRLIFDDDAILPEATRWDGRYLNWYFSLNATNPADKAIIDAIKDPDDGIVSTCLGGGKYAKYMRSRATAAQLILREVICQVNAEGDVRFGLAQFREGGDPAGGFVRVPIDSYTQAQADALELAIQDLSPETWTPLAESLFQIYTYFMSRDAADRPFGKNGTTKFPKYSYDTTTNYPGGKYSASGPPTVPDSPVQNRCQKHFVVVITDGEPTMDDFDSYLDGSGSLSLGFGDFRTRLIGDYNADSETEEPYASEGALYLDDIALFMQTKDFRPDLDGDQVIDVYTVGFTTSPAANDLLAKTAAVGNGQFFFSNNAEELTNAIVAAISDILQKAVSFTNPTVPASRSAEGSNFYATYFKPHVNPFWAGHLTNFDFSLEGEILDRDGNCALEGDPDPCSSGPLETNPVLAPPFWDAQDEMPLAANRQLYFSRLGAMSAGTKPLPFDAVTVTKDDLKAGGAKLDKNFYIPIGSQGGNEDSIADEIVQWLRGCAFGSNPCVDRAERLADIFHSTPLLVGPPNGAIAESSYLQFAQDHATRTKLLYVGSNGGFVHSFVAEVWDATQSPPAYNREHADAGQERMGFMPYPVRNEVAYYPRPGTGKFYAVDASPQAADVWFPSNTTDVTKSADEWRTILVGGLRQGGNTYYALDVTHPDTPAQYPKYLWEFPCEGVGSCDDFVPWMGQTWSEPVITRVRVAMGGNDNGGQGFERWVAIFGAGYAPESDPNNRDGSPVYDAKAEAGRAIFMVDVQTGKVLAAKRYISNENDGQEEMLYAIPSSPAVFDLDFDGFADVVYVGDLGGNLWKWAVRSVGEYSTNGSHDESQPNWPFRKFLEAAPHTEGGATYYKSFFYPPTGALHAGVLRLATGTGERNDLYEPGVAAPQDADNNRFFVVKDDDPNEIQGGHTTIVGDEPDLVDVTDIANAECATVQPATGFFIVGGDREKFVEKATIFLGTVFVPSFVPVESGDPCVTGGDAYLRAFDMFCGGAVLEQPPGAPPGTDERVIDIGLGLPSRPRITIGDVSGGGGGGGGGGDPCSSLVVVTTSDGATFSACSGDPTSRPVMHENWRER